MSRQDFETVQEYWDSLQPEICKDCECSELDFTREGNPVWLCELMAQGEPCYKGSSTNSKEQRRPE